MKKKIALLSLAILVLSGFFLIFGNIQKTNADEWTLNGGNTQRNNENFLNQNFWAANPSDQDIIKALFGSGNSGSAYTQNWSYKCNTENMIVIKTNTLPVNLESNRVYLLTGEAYITNIGITNFNSCLAIISSHPKGTTFYSESSLDYMIAIPKVGNVIIDNLSINGYENGIGDNHEKNNDGIIGKASAQNITINNVSVFNNLLNGIKLEGRSTYFHINNINTYNNASYGIFVDSSHHNIINNVKSYNNSKDGIYIINSSYNTINNTQIFKNYVNGLETKTSNFITINNCQIYNNDYGMYMLEMTNSKINNVHLYGNRFANDFFLDSNSSNNKFYGNNIRKFGGNPSGISAGNSSEYGYLGRVNGTHEIPTIGKFDLRDYFTNPINNEGFFLYPLQAPTYNINRNINYDYQNTITEKCSYGSGIFTQAQPVRYIVEELEKFGTGTYDTSNYIGSDVPKIDGEFTGDVPLYPWGTSITGPFQVSVIVPNNSLIDYYNIFGAITPNIIGKTIGTTNVIVLENGIGFKKFIPQIWGSEYYATHREEKTQNRCGGREQTKEDREECDLGENNGPNSACSEICKLNLPTCTLSANPTNGYAPLETTFTISEVNTSWMNFDYLHFGDGNHGNINTGILTYQNTYNNTGSFTGILQVSNIYSGDLYTTCEVAIKTIQKERCGDNITQNLNSNGEHEQCDGEERCDENCQLIEGEKIYCEIGEIAPIYSGETANIYGNLIHTRVVVSGVNFGLPNNRFSVNLSGDYYTGYTYYSGGVYEINLRVFHPGDSNINYQCKGEIKVGYCGDGNTDSGYEECDGEARCDENCKKGETYTFCGDHITQNPNSNGEYEQCDGEERCGQDCKILKEFAHVACEIEMNEFVYSGSIANITGTLNEDRVIVSGVNFGLPNEIFPINVAGNYYTGYQYYSGGNYKIIMYVVHPGDSSIKSKCEKEIKIGYCGDGETNIGYEECDKGEANGQNSLCSSDCTKYTPTCSLSANKNTISLGENIEFTINLSDDWLRLNNLYFGDGSGFNFGGVSGILETGYDYVYGSEGTYSPYALVQYSTTTSAMNIRCDGENIIVNSRKLPNLFVEKYISQDESINTSTLITYTINYGNNGNGTGFGVVLTDEIPDNFTGHWSHLGLFNDGILTLFEGDLIPGQTGQIILTGYATDIGTLTNIASISGANHDQVDDIVITEVESFCGNGIPEGEEECDNGLENGPMYFCSNNCTVNIIDCFLSAEPTTIYLGESVNFSLELTNEFIHLSELQFGDSGGYSFGGITGVLETGYSHIYNMTGTHHTRFFGSFFPQNDLIIPATTVVCNGPTITVIEHPTPNLFVNKSIDQDIIIKNNTLITYTINYGNIGNGTGFGVILTDNIPNNFTGNRGDINNGILTLFEGDLAPGQTGQIILTGYATASGLLENTVFMSGSNHEEIAAIVTGDVYDIPYCNLESDKTTILSGENIHFTINLSHNAAILNYLNFGNNDSFDFGGVSGILQTGYDYIYNSQGTYTPVVTIQAPGGGQNIYCTGHEIVVNTQKAPILFINKSISPNENITTDTLLTYTIDYGNNGNGTGLAVVLTDIIPENFTGNRGIINNGILTFPIGNLAPGRTGKLILTGYATVSGLLENTVFMSGSNHEEIEAIVTGDVYDNICGNGILEINEQCDLGENNGQNSACSYGCTFSTPNCNLIIPETVQAGIQFTSIGTVNQNWIAFSGVSLGDGNRYSFGGLTNVFQRTYSYAYDSIGDYTQIMYVYNPLNPGIIYTCTGNTKVVGPNLFVNKSISPTQDITLETLITYTINYGNNGSGAALNVLLTDAIPNNFNGNRNHIGVLSGNVLRLFSGILNPGQTGQIILTGYATNRGQLSNTATISGSNASAKDSTITKTILRNICGNGIVERGEYCDDGEMNGTVGYCEKDCSKFIKNQEHSSAGVMCKYEDENYISNGPFPDTINHRGYNYIETMRRSCLHRGNSSHLGLRRYGPDTYSTKAEVLKTLVKIMGIKNEDFDIVTEDTRYYGVQIFADVNADHWFSWYTDYAYKVNLTNELYTIKDNKKYLKPGETINRYEVIKKIMETYKKIISNEKIDISSKSNLTDISSKNPYYKYVREAEVLGIISGARQTDGTYKFIGDKPLTRAEFAKIVSIPFENLLFVD